MATILSQRFDFNLFKEGDPPATRSNVFIPKQVQLFPHSTKKVSDKAKQLAGAIVKGVDNFNVQSTLQNITDIISSGKFVSAVPLLPLVFRLNREPYTLEDHFFFEPWFSTLQASSITWCTGRQVGKSMTMAASTCLRALLVPGYKTLHITPLYNMIHRFSVNYVKPFIDYSPIHDLFINAMCTQAINQRNFLNGSVLYFSFASRDLTRTRGYDAWSVCYDELQSMDSDFIPVINQSTSGAPANMRQIVRAGTPMTMENPLQKALASGSWAEWHVRCTHCNHWNIPDLEHDLDKMLGPKNPKWHISRETPGVVCAKCQRPLDVRNGLWVHKRPEIRYDHASYHIPQLILPQHCESDKGWRRIQAYRQGDENTTPQKFYNELMGVSYDHGARLITLTELQAACTLPISVFNIRKLFHG
jgi:hypothetical protein